MSEIDRLAAEIACLVFPDDIRAKKNLEGLLIDFAWEVKRSAIEP